MTTARKIREITGVLTYWLVERGPKLYLVTTYPNSDLFFAQSYPARRTIPLRPQMKADIKQAIFG